MHKLRTIEMHRLTVEEFKEAKKLPLVVVLDNVRSLYNVGSVFRSCDAFRVEAKTALGGEDSVDWKYFKNTEDAVAELQREGYFVYSIEQVEGSTKLQHLRESLATQREKGVAQRYAVVFGNEVKGVLQSVVDMSDGCLEIPQFGTKHSLNVSVTAGIVVWEFAKHLLLQLK